MKIYIQTTKATTNTFGLHTQPRKTTRYTNILKVMLGGGGGGRKKNLSIFSIVLHVIMAGCVMLRSKAYAEKFVHDN